MRRWGNVSAAVLVAVALLSFASEAAAGAAGPPLATVDAATPLSAGNGWLVWSAPEGRQWTLMAYHAGSVVRLPVSPRAQPFDASVGTDVAGLPVVTFSRCAQTPRMRTVGEQGGGGGALLEPASGAGCRIRVLELTDGAEIKPPIPAPRECRTPPRPSGTVRSHSRATPLRMATYGRSSPGRRRHATG